MRSFLKFYRLLRGGAVLRGTAVTRQSIIVIQYFGFTGSGEKVGSSNFFLRPGEPEILNNNY